MRKLIIVTGAAGFIGSCLVRHFNDNGFDDLILVDDLDDQKWKNLVGKSFLDIFSKDKLFDYLKNSQSEIFSIIHLGACSDTTCSDAGYLLENNYRYTKNLCEYSLINNIRFIYASSAATYGDGKMGFSDDENLLDTLKPINMYGYSKHLFDLFAKKENLLNKIVGLKYFNVFGPNEYHKDHMASMILKMSSVARNKDKIKLFKSNDQLNFKDGEQKRDFIYVKDAVKMTALFLENNYLNVHGIFNIGTGKTTTWNQLAKALFDSLNQESKIEYIDMPKNLLKQYQNYTCAEMKKFHSILKTPFKFTSINDSVKDYMQNYLLLGERW